MDRKVCYAGKNNNDDCGIQCEACAQYGFDRRVSERRGNSLSFKLWEKRKGFDRRQNSLRDKGLYHRIFMRGAFHLKDNFPALIALLIVFNFFNMTDYLFTLKALDAGYAEGNPVMDRLFSIGPVAAFAFKVAVGFFITSIIWLLKKYRLVLELSILILIVYMLLILYHIYGAVRFY